MKLFSMLFVLSFAIYGSAGNTPRPHPQRRTSNWRQASDPELRSVIPARAPVISERIETEMRTASGITDGHHKFIALVVMITAGYAAEGKYNDFLITQVPIKIGTMALKPGNYVFGAHRKDDSTLELSFYEASTGSPTGIVEAIHEKEHGAIRSLSISPPENGAGLIGVGRFAVQYTLGS